jgi:hypothetical protein
MLTKIGTYILNFFLEKIWGLLYKAILVGVDYFTELIIYFRRKEKLKDNAKKLEDAVKSGNKDEIAKAGENALNNN